ncbi:DsbA family oxidoreductase [Nocardioides caldifontis]|uniref:DsbA family oxidoreductase n=1 Tax=Nocardioides caldifontis TaxID=2588938 RepID=UPI0011DF975F|nr:DsbA family oxidoreductase [Nocardioides caldifontis]
MLIEIWSDVVCPWCYIGKRRLEEALTSFEHADEVDVVFRSFELDPTAPQVGTESVAEALGRKYGGGVDAVRPMMDRVAVIAAEVGLEFDYEHATHTKTVDAHRLLHEALAQGGPALQRELKERLLAAYFLRGRSMGDHEVLREVAVGAGLDAVRVDAVLAGDEHVGAVRADIDQARAYGATGVPFFVVDRRYGVSGAQPTGVFSELLQRAWDDSHPGLQMLADGTVCGPDGCAV